MIVTHLELVRLIGEIDAIELVSENTTIKLHVLQDVVVYVEIARRRYEMIRALRSGEGLISHAITRYGITAVLENKK